MPAIAGELRAENAILDGEIVCPDTQGRSLFKELLYRRGNPFFYSFDLLWLNGRDLRQVPLLKRKQMLRRIVRGGRHNRLMYALHVESCGCELFRDFCKLDLEGVVANHKDGFYSPYSPSTKWIKIKNPNYHRLKVDTSCLIPSAQLTGHHPQKRRDFTRNNSTRNNLTRCNTGE